MFICSGVTIMCCIEEYFNIYLLHDEVFEKMLYCQILMASYVFKKIPNKMKDRELKNHICHFLKEENKKRNPMRFVRSVDESSIYCRQMLLRKKLKPYNVNEKMDKLFKGFEHVVTYIDVPQLHRQLKYTILKMYKEKKFQNIEKQKQNFHPNLSMKKRSKNCPQIIESRINDLYSKKKSEFFYFSEMEKIDELLSSLNLQKVITKEGRRQIDSEQLLKRCLQEKKQRKSHNGNSSLIEFEKINLTAEQNLQIDKILQKISTYLMINLLNMHKEKWEKKKPAMYSLHEQIEQKSAIKQRNTFHFSNKKQLDSRTKRKRTTRLIFAQKSIKERKMIEIKPKTQKQRKLKRYNLRSLYLNKIKNLIEKVSEEQTIFQKDKQELKRFLDKLPAAWEETIPELEKVLNEIGDKIVEDNFCFKTLASNLS